MMYYLNMVLIVIFLFLSSFFLAGLVYRWFTWVDTSTPPLTGWRRSWARLLAAGKESATKLWAFVMIVCGSGVGLIVEVANALNMPEVSEAIKAWLTPQVAAIMVITAMLISVLARNRTMH